MSVPSHEQARKEDFVALIPETSRLPCSTMSVAFFFIALDPKRYLAGATYWK